VRVKSANGFLVTWRQFYAQDQIEYAVLERNGELSIIPVKAQWGLSIYAMPAIYETKPIEDSIAKINNEFAVGSDPIFKKMRRIWACRVDRAHHFHHFVFCGSIRTRSGRECARARFWWLHGYWLWPHSARWHSVGIDYRFSAVSSVQNEAVQLWTSDSLVKPLGTHRVIPQPASSVLGGGGMLYTFPASTVPLTVEFQMQPAAIGSSELKLQMPGRATVRLHIFVMPWGLQMATLIHAVLGYFFLLLVVRTLARRPGAQMTPFEFVLIFLIGGVIILATAGEDRSITNCYGAVFIICLMHRLMNHLKMRSKRLGAIIDATPVVLLKDGQCCAFCHSV
jgi:uncharacterized membrane protein YcaP (DUF421 family)